MVASKVMREMGRLFAILGFCAIATGSLNARSENAKSQPAPTPSIDISRTPATGPMRPISLDDMVSLREVHEPRQSPDGQHVAFLVRQAFRQCDCYRTALYLASPRGDIPPQKLAEEDYIAKLQWTPDSHSVSYLSSKGGSVQLWRQDVRTQRAHRLFVHAPNGDRTATRMATRSRYIPPFGLQDYRWSPDGRQIAFTAEPAADPSIAAANAKEGFRYDDATMGTFDLVFGDWAAGHRSKQVWLYDLREKRERLVWAAPTAWGTSITALLWSPSGQKLAFLYSTSGAAGADRMEIVDVATSAVSQVGTPGDNLFYSEGAVWLPNDREIAFLGRPPVGGSYTLQISDVVDHSRRELARNVNPGHDPWLAWDADQHRFLFLSEGLGPDRRQAGIYALPQHGGEAVRLTTPSGMVSDCDAILQGKIACVWQTTSISPRAALVSMSDLRVQSLADINPELASVELATARELHWKNKYGDETNGFLVLPAKRVPGVSVPLVVMGYGFSGEFVAQANSVLTTYPAQAFVRDGIAVLLFNYPRYEGWEGDNFELGSKALGYGPLSSIQAIVEQLNDEGLIDIHRVGMMGHSLAGFWVQLAITQTDLFKAVEMHNGGTFSEPGTYWKAGSARSRTLQEHIMGGPPYGKTLKNYVGYSMTLNASRIRAPVLMEYDALEAIDAMEYYEAMEHYHVPVDFFVYPNDGHVIERPEHRFMSLQRNLDWFEFWLLDKENDASSKPEQYARWRQMKALTEENAAPTHIDRQGNQ